MAPKSPRNRVSTLPAHRRLARFVRPRCEPLESRITPALFNVQSPLTFAGLNNNGCVAVADLNKDGLPDAVLTNFGLDYGALAGTTITVLYGKAGGGFSRINLNTSGQNVSFASIADINGDTWPDVVVTNANRQNTGSVSVFKNDGAGNLSLVGTPFSTFSNNPSWVGLADVTGDGVLDAIVASFGKDAGAGSNVVGNNVTIFQGNSDGQGHGDFTFSAGPITTLAPAIEFVPTALAVADFDGDGLKDIAATVPGVPPSETAPQPIGSVYLFKGTGSGGFAAPNILESGGALPINIQAADLNGDNKPDLVVANAGDPNSTPEFKDNGVGVLLNVSSPGNLAFGVTNSLTANCYGTFAVAVADFDMDGKKDIAAINYGSQATLPDAFVSAYMGNGSGVFTPASPGTFDTQTGFGGGQYLAVGDFDGNNTPDLIVAHASNVVGLLLNTSVAPASTSTALTSSANPSVTGQAVTFTATVSAASGTPSGGTVTFFNNGVQIGSPVALTGQQAQVTTSTLTAGTHSITATYSGAQGFAGSSSNTVSQVVNTAVVPLVTINQGSGQPDPTNASPITFDVHFSQAVTGFDGSDILFTGSTVGGTPAAAVSGTGQDYTVTVTGMTGTGKVMASIPAGAAINSVGTPNAASTSTDNTVTFDDVPPTVTINQGVGQNDPTNGSSIKFDVKFSEPVTGFTASDVSLGGSTAGGTLSVSVTGSLDTYTVTVTGMTTQGLVVASIPAGGATDAAGNPNLASTSTDNSVQFVNTGTLGFTQAVYKTTEDSGTVTITVTRSGQTEGAVSIGYATSDGTAHSGGSATTGQADYTPVTGTLSWAAGEGGDKTFTITILPDELNEGKELINLTLSNPVGSPALGLTTATVAIAPSDGKVIDATARVPSAMFTDAPGLAGDLVTVRLAGLVGTATVYITDPDGDRNGPIELIDLASTDPLRSRLIITAKKPLGGTGDGRASLAEVTGTGLKFLSAPTTDLNGPGINLTGFLSTLRIGNISGGADIKMGAAPSTILRPAVRISAGVIADGTDITVPVRLASLTAISVGDGTITAPSAGAIVARGKPATRTAPAIVGNFNSDVLISGPAPSPLMPALARLRAAGSIAGATINVAGNLGTISVGSRGVGDLTGTTVTVGTLTAPANLNAVRVAGKVNQSTFDVTGNVLSVSVGSFWNSRLDAGYTGPDDGSGKYDLPSFVGTFRVTSLVNGFQSSNVIATTINSVTLASVNPDNGGTKFGVTAAHALKALAVTSPLQRFRFNPLAGSPQTIPALGDFRATDLDGPG
ncbi:MAG TPA: FG-GAP-like repeat-containing protein [Gemmataceae bacterium]|nr:FG-GAP-like repeat-containing protein [Gemmataceae bacterium]